MCVALFFGAGQHLVKPLLAPHAAALGADIVSVGVVVAAQGTGGLLVALPIGAAIDKMGGHRVMTLGSVVFIAGAVVMSLATSPAALGVGYFVFGAGGVTTWLAAQTLCTVGQDDVSTRRTVARVSTAVLAGHLCGPPLGGFLADTLSAQAAFVASAIAGVMLIPAALAFPRRSLGRAVTTKPPPTQRSDSGASIRTLLTRKGLLAMVMIAAMAAALGTVRQSFLPLHLDRLGWSSTTIGLVLSVAGMGAVLSRAGLPLLDRRFGRTGLTLLCVVPGALALGAAIAVESVVIVAVLVGLSGFSLGLAGPVTLLFTARLTSTGERGRAVSLRIASNRVAQALMPLAFGAIAGLVGLLAAFWLLVAVCIAGGSSVAWSGRSREP